MSDNDQPEVIDSSALEAMERASIDVQISTAKKYPRSLAKVKQTMLSFATLDVETARSTFYRLPPRKAKPGQPPNKPIEGPSIRMAEIALASYGHLRAGARVISDDGRQITAQGVCHDLENNVLVSIEVKRRVIGSTGQRYSDDVVVLTGNAACAIALRNAVFKVVPYALVKPVYEAAKKLAVGEGKSLASRRVEAIQYFVDLGIHTNKIFAALGVKGIEDVGFEQIATLIGYANAVKESEATLKEIFDPVLETTTATVEEALGAKKQAAPVEKPRDEPKEPAKPVVDPTVEKAERDELENLCLDLDLTPGRLIKVATAAGQKVPDGAKRLSELPAETIAFLVQQARHTKQVIADQAAAEKKE